jgi:hypothetical protein
VSATLNPSTGLSAPEVSVNARIAGLVAVSLPLLAGAGCRRAGTPQAVAPPVAASPVTLDGQPVTGRLSLEDLREAHDLRISAEAEWSCRLALASAERSKLRYYGLPCYPDVVGARQLDPSHESSTSDVSGCEVSVVTSDSIDAVVGWYAKRLKDWARTDLRADAPGAESGTPATSDSPLVGVVFRQSGGRRRVMIDALPRVGLVLVGYEILPEDEPVRLPATREASRKEDDVTVLTMALEDYRRDTGIDAESAGALAADKGPSGYRGPYLARVPHDPYSGKPYTVRKGKVVGPGDMQTFGS